MNISMLSVDILSHPLECQKNPTCVGMNARKVGREKEKEIGSRERERERKKETKKGREGGRERACAHAHVPMCLCERMCARCMCVEIRAELQEALQNCGTLCYTCPMQGCSSVIIAKIGMKSAGTCTKSSRPSLICGRVCVCACAYRKLDLLREPVFERR